MTRLPANDTPRRLSELEIKCLQLCVNGKTVLEIATQLQRSEFSIPIILKHARTKLRAKTTAQAVKLAVKNHILE